MNEIDYELEIIGEKKTYSPRIEFVKPIAKSPKRIFEITADNSYGKTFILNLIAYALEADKLDNDRILKSIKDSISRYDDTAAYNLEYNISLNLPDEKTLLLTKSNGKSKLIQIDGSPPVGYNVLHENLSIIYDVPTNPSERLNAVIKDLGLWNDNLTEKVVSISRFFNEVRKDFDSVRDEDKIRKLGQNSIAIEDKIASSKIKIDNQKEILNQLKTIDDLRQLLILLKRRTTLESDILRKSKQFKLLKRPAKIEKKDVLKIQKLSTELADFESSFKQTILRLISEINADQELNTLINDDKSNLKHYSRVKDKTLPDIIDTSDDYIIAQTEFITSIEYLKEAIDSFVLGKKQSESFKIHNSYTKFVELLEGLIDNNIDHFLKDATAVDTKKLKLELEAIIKKHRVKDYKDLMAFMKGDLKLLKGIFTQYVRTQAQLKKENEKMHIDNEGKYYKLEGELKSLKESLKKAKSEFSLTSARCANFMEITDLSRLDSIDKISRYQSSYESTVSNSGLLDNIRSSRMELERGIRQLEKSVSDLEGEKRMTDRSLTMENAKNPSKYNEQQKKRIKLFIVLLQRINVNINSFKELISSIESGQLSKINDSEDLDFVLLAGKIIAFSMDNKLLRADGVYAELKFYDMMKQEFHCDEDLIIKKQDVSTGLASANYLKQRIDNIEGKYVVVLLDEIGNMAQNAIDKVIESIKKLETQNRLVLAIFTRPNSKGINVIEY